MFNLFKKKEGSVKVKDVIWMNSEAKWNGVVDLWKKDENTIFVFWFDESLREAQKALSQQINGNINLVTAGEIRFRHVENKTVVFAEHYPLKKKEEELFQNLRLEEVRILSSLDEPLFKRFGSDKIIQLMKQMGISEKQSVEHNLITKAIHNAQEKMESKVSVEQSAHSQNDWLEKNLPPKAQ
jgi:hypothetical protein